MTKTSGRIFERNEDGSFKEVQTTLGIECTISDDGTFTAAVPPEGIDQYLANAKGGYSSEEIKAAFDLVKDKTNWKMPIDAIIDRSQMDVVRVGIEWYAATEAVFEETNDPNKVRVTSIGYYNGPAGP